MLSFTETSRFSSPAVFAVAGAPVGLSQTVLVKDIVVGTAGSAPGQLTNVGGALYFMVSGGLYKSNGTAAGTSLVKSFTRIPSELTNLNGVLYFTDGDDVWRSNGTALGTVVGRGRHPAAL